MARGTRETAAASELARFLDRLEPLLAQAERWLRRRTAAAIDADALERNSAFRWQGADGDSGRLEPIGVFADFDLGDLIGVNAAIEALDRNTRQLVAGLPFNDVLLHGERGTGKSSAVRGLVTRYAERGLRVVGVDRRDLAALPRLLVALRTATREVPGRYSFLVFCDDLSFGPMEPGFRELKAALEGGLEARPDRVCVVATSNRRHLVPETMAENRAARVDTKGQLHLGEALEEKLALADRFGLVLGFYACSQPTYLEIVAHWIRASGGELDDAAREAALRYALERGGRSGRVARQFTQSWVGGARLADGSGSGRDRRDTR